MITRREALRKMLEIPGATGILTVGIVLPVVGIEAIQSFENRIEKLRQMKEVACMPGTVDYDPYFLGMANGIICALSIVEKENYDPQFLSAPAEWGYERREARLVIEARG